MNIAPAERGLTPLIGVRPVSRFEVWMLVLIGASVDTGWQGTGSALCMAATVPAALSCIMRRGTAQMQAARSPVGTTSLSTASP